MEAQRSPEWVEHRLGKLTGSRIADATAKGKSGADSVTREKYKMQLVAERLTGVSQSPDISQNEAVQWGVEQEDQARLAYEFFTDTTVELVGFITHPTIEMSGASPDGLVGKDGLVEFKCPNTSTHLKYLLDNKAPATYIKQMTWQLACTGREWCDFVSYDSRLPYDKQLFVIRFKPSEQDIANLESEAVKFLAEVNEMLIQLNRRSNKYGIR